MNYLVIPAYQPDQKLHKLVHLRENVTSPIIVVDDGSSEGLPSDF